MAETPQPDVLYKGTCPDCAKRTVELPAPLPQVGDDFDWQVRDYDGFRLFMLEELAARFPERLRWTPADMEVVIVEVLAAVLDQLSDMVDRVAAEAFLETARQPESVWRLLNLIGYDAVQMARGRNEIRNDTDEQTGHKELLRYWSNNPHAMEMARRRGPRHIFTQHRMVTVNDYSKRLEDHPLVWRAHAWHQWTGAWTTVCVALILWDNTPLDKDNLTYPYELRTAVKKFHEGRGIVTPEWDASPSIRMILRLYLDAYRMAGQEVLLQNAKPVGISMALSVRVKQNYFRSEVRDSVDQALGKGPEGFFRPGRLRFGEDLHASDIVERLMALEGVEIVCFNRFKRIGAQYADQSGSGHIRLNGLEVAVCDNDPARHEYGYYQLTLHGGCLG